MALDEQEQAKATEAILAAAYAPEMWPAALEWVARAGGGWGAQILGVSTGGDLRFDFASGIPPVSLTRWEELGGPDPNVNTRARSLRAPLWRVVDDYDLASPGEIARSRFYQEFLKEQDGPFMSLARVPGPEEMAVVAGALRSGRQGRPSAEDRDGLAALLPHLAAALRLQLRLGAQALAVARGALDAARVPAFLCDAEGAVLAATGDGETELRRADTLRFRRGRLEAVDSGCDVELRAALEAAAARSGERGVRSHTVVLRRGERGPRLAEVSPLPLGAFDLRAGAVALVALPARRSADGLPALLCRTFGFTAAEAGVAAGLLEGDALDAIAEARGAAYETARGQAKAVLRKTGTQSQAALVALLARVVGPVGG